MKIWLDDRRKMPKDYDYWAKNAYDAIGALTVEIVTAISFDHDLGTEHTGHTVASYIERLASKDLIGRLNWNVHSDNPVGRRRIELAMRSADRFWDIYDGPSTIKRRRQYDTKV